MDQDVTRFIYFIFLTTFLIDLGSCTHYSKYIEYDIEHGKDCHTIGSNKQNKDIAVIVKITLDRGINADTHCKFVIKANKGDGLFGVIQKMTFRRNKTECVDYVQFKRSDRQETQKFCGNFDRNTTKYYPVPEPENSTYELGSFFSGSTYAEFDIGGKLETTIFIAKKGYLFPEKVPTLSIVYTPYKKCKGNILINYTAIPFDSCILQDYFCDGYQNCAPNICQDEATCSNANDIINNTGTKVTVGAVTTIILCTILFGVCIWACKKKDLLFWSSDCAGPSAHSSLSRSGGQESGSTSNPQVPTAPMLEVVVPPPVLDKDLPPSYDSLFPEQNNSTMQ
ncbi:uncharacterized protein LOC122632443 [Vespula pensylvanica]|uniref:Uncharacterized protein n=1 Tax=Vespula pensylvanica TaxID=30213 RepID=A0A834NSG3_VESPE|nr:uncharacterized protein LOC122632443 [Vespula pensylvanica]XP_043675153.1 uncharacterized protein LOC122632443 [Vespula pensylvanica]XP_043675154.1 uncharacterized protein LOC122632443 [Vespula pensylvanica]XP_043675155.1 uncharacterized protein LOC122632443 [Vespula pensylvanica]KAF7417179.1 hypothetical protein H0235_011710 [Vespula pensylvanica]